MTLFLGAQSGFIEEEDNDDDVIALIESKREAWGVSDPKRQDIFLAFQKNGPVWDRNMDEFIKYHFQGATNSIKAYTWILPISLF